MREHIRNLRPGWIAFGWFIAICITSMIILALNAFGIAGSGSSAESTGVALALVAGFLIAGYFVGSRVAAAPISHGLAMGLFSLVAWVVINLTLGEPTGVTTWRALEPGSLSGLLGLQMASSVIGARVAVRRMRRGK